MKLSEFTTRRDAADHLTALGITGTAAEALLQESTGARHQWRVARTVEAARAAAPESMGEGERRLYAAGLLILDLLGVGGRQGVQGLATARLPAFETLGKGRKHAGDGDAWMGAAREALYQLAPEGGSLELAPDDDAPYGVFCHDPRDRAESEPIGPIAALRGPALRPWLLTAAREGLRRAVGLPGWHEVPCITWGDLDAPAAWARLVNALEAMPEPAPGFGAPDDLEALRQARAEATAP